jgi:hypothetical protein
VSHRSLRVSLSLEVRDPRLATGIATHVCGRGDEKGVFAGELLGLLWVLVGDLKLGCPRVTAWDEPESMGSDGYSATFQVLVLLSGLRMIFWQRLWV